MRSRAYKDRARGVHNKASRAGLGITAVNGCQQQLPLQVGTSLDVLLILVENKTNQFPSANIYMAQSNKLERLISSGSL